MDSMDTRLLKLIQNNFPVCSRPYQKLGEKLGISEAETIEKIKRLKKEGVIRRLGAVFDSRKLGYHSTLCAMEVSRAKLLEVVEIVNNYPGVTHNYLRNHDYNLWFTLICPNELYMRKTLAEIEEKSGLKVYTLPALRLFKINVHFHIPYLGGEELVQRIR